MDMNDWATIANDIDKYYKQFDGFVILHGTDTMCYTASALSFMLECLGKSVVMTGSQVCHDVNCSVAQLKQDLKYLQTYVQAYHVSITKTLLTLSHCISYWILYY